MPRFDIAITGEINLDLILYGLPEQMATERELLASDFAITLGSSSAILAHNMAALGSKVAFTTKVGGDSFGTAALERLRQRGVNLERVVTGGKSGVTILLPHETRRHILTFLGTISELRFEDLDLQYLTSARHFHLSSPYLQQQLLPRAAELFRQMKSAGLTTSLDTNDDPDDRYQGLDEILPFVDILMPNEREALRIAQCEDLETALATLAKKVKTIVVKRGAHVAIAVREGERFAAPVVPISVIDSVGAGDSFDAGFLHQFVRGADLPSCLAYGNLCGALCATASGGTEAFRDSEAMQRFFAQHMVAK
jgi:sugar/nucleoside kinase (ribokinase family)